MKHQITKIIKVLDNKKTYPIFVTSTTSGAGVKIFSLVSKTFELTLKILVYTRLSKSLYSKTVDIYT